MTDDIKQHDDDAETAEYLKPVRGMMKQEREREQKILMQPFGGDTAQIFLRLRACRPNPE